MSPFKSEKQKGWMFANIPETARKWARYTARKNRVKKGRHRSKSDPGEHDYRDE